MFDCFNFLSAFLSVFNKLSLIRLTCSGLNKSCRTLLKNNSISGYLDLGTKQFLRLIIFGKQLTLLELKVVSVGLSIKYAAVQFVNEFQKLHNHHKPLASLYL